MGWRARILVGGVVLVACAAVAASALARRALTFHVRWTVTPYIGVLTGDRYTLLQTAIQGEAGIAFDELTGRRTAVWLPQDCPEPEGPPVLGGPWLLENCTASRVDLYSLAGGYWRDVEIAPGCRDLILGQETQCTVMNVGSDWIEFGWTTPTSYRLVFQNIASGELRRDPTDYRTVADPDSVNLAQRLCSPVRVPAGDQLAFDGGFAIGLGSPDDTLERCGTKRRLVLQDGIGISIFAGEWLDTPAIVWQSRARELNGVFLPSLRRFTATETPPPHYSRFAVLDGQLQFSDRHLYDVLVLGSRGLSSGRHEVVLSASLPSEGS